MSNKHLVCITSNPIVIQEAFDFVADPAHGAADCFIGAVRDHNLGRQVKGITYEVHADLTEKVCVGLCKEIQKQWGETLKIYISHFHGRLDIGGISIVIAVSSPHRDESFKACRFLIEEIKHRCPIWKKEHYIDGDSEWVKGHALCSHGNKTNHSNIIGVVLAGGKSSRMGQDKAMLPYRNKRLIDHMVEILSLTDLIGIKKTVVSGEIEGFDCVKDLVNERGPIGGIYSVLKRILEENQDVDGTPSLLILPVDMPHLNADLLQGLIINRDNNTPQYDAICYETYPLPFFLRCSNHVMTTLETMIQNKNNNDGEISIHALLQKLSTCYVPIHNITQKLFSNINTFREWNDYTRCG